VHAIIRKDPKKIYCPCGGDYSNSMHWHPRYDNPQESHEKTQLHQRWVESEKAKAALAKAKAALAKAKADTDLAKAKADLEKIKTVKKVTAKGKKK
jgi:hypothetical protein